MFQAFHLSETMEQPVQQPKQGTKTDASPPIPVLQLYQLGTKKNKKTAQNTQTIKGKMKIFLLYYSSLL